MPRAKLPPHRGGNFNDHGMGRNARQSSCTNLPRTGHVTSVKQFFAYNSAGLHVHPTLGIFTFPTGVDLVLAGKKEVRREGSCQSTTDVRVVKPALPDVARPAARSAALCALGVLPKAKRIFGRNIAYLVAT